MKPVAYIETSFISRALSRNSAVGGDAKAARLFMRHFLREVVSDYRLVYSSLTLDEARKGRYGRVREDYLRRFALLTDTPPMTGALASALLKSCGAPASQMADMVHLAVAALSGAAIFLTEDHKHIANPARIKAFGESGLRFGFPLPTLATHTGFMEMPRSNPRRRSVEDRLLDAIHRNRAQESKKMGGSIRSINAYLRRLDAAYGARA